MLSRTKSNHHFLGIDPFVVLYCEQCHEWAHPEHAAARDRVPTITEVMEMIRNYRGR